MKIHAIKLHLQKNHDPESVSLLLAIKALERAAVEKKHMNYCCCTVCDTYHTAKIALNKIEEVFGEQHAFREVSLL